jgi:hypothetical protein
MAGVVVTRPAEVTRVRVELSRHLEGAAPVLDESQPLFVAPIPNARVAVGDRFDQRASAITRAVIAKHQRQRGVGLREQRLERLLEVLAVPVERHAEHQRGGTHVEARRHPTTCR